MYILGVSPGRDGTAVLLHTGKIVAAYGDPAHVLSGSVWAGQERRRSRSRPRTSPVVIGDFVIERRG